MKLPATENILEIAVHSYQSALCAEKGGADRIELCNALQTGGLTPDLGLLHLVLASVSLPVHVLIRPRLGNFCYDDYEFKTIIESVKVCRSLNVAGVVVGCLKEDGTVEQDKMQKIKEVAGHLDLTFHRAIDVCTQVLEALDYLVELEFNRVLTSGGSRSAWEGRDNIKKMVRHTFASGLSIMPGAGVDQHNARRLIEHTGAREIHASAKTIDLLPAQDPIGLTFINGTAIESRWESDPEKIRAIKASL